MAEGLDGVLDSGVALALVNPALFSSRVSAAAASVAALSGFASPSGFTCGTVSALASTFESDFPNDGDLMGLGEGGSMIPVAAVAVAVVAGSDTGTDPPAPGFAADDSAADAPGARSELSLALPVFLVGSSLVSGSGFLLSSGLASDPGFLPGSGFTLPDFLIVVSSLTVLSELPR